MSSLKISSLKMKAFKICFLGFNFIQVVRLQVSMSSDVISHHVLVKCGAN